MNTIVTIPKHKHLWSQKLNRVLSLVSLAVLFLTACRMDSFRDGAPSKTGEQQIFHADRVSTTGRTVLLPQLSCEEVSPVPEANSVLLTGSTEELRRAGLVLELVDTGDDLVIERLGSTSVADTTPSNSEIEKSLGEISIGTFAEPSPTDSRKHGIVEARGDSELTSLPAGRSEQLMKLLKQVNRESTSDCAEPDLSEHQELNHTMGKSEIFVHNRPPCSKITVPAKSTAESWDHAEQLPIKAAQPGEHSINPSYGLEKKLSNPTVGIPWPDSKVPEEVAQITPSFGDDGSDWEPKTVKIVLEFAGKTAQKTILSEPVQLQNGDDVLHLALPDIIYSFRKRNGQFGSENDPIMPMIQLTTL